MTQRKKNAASLAGAAEAISSRPFTALRELLVPYRNKLQVVHDDPGHFYANCAQSDSKGKAQFFGAVKASGKKHLLHFMPVYDFPELLDGISPALKKRMQGKSCFNFDTLDPVLHDELKGLIKQGVERYRSAGKL